MKESFLPADSQAQAYVHTHSRGTSQETVSTNRTGKPGHTQRKVNLPLPTSCHSTASLNNSQSMARSHIWKLNQCRIIKKSRSLLTGWWRGAVPADGQSRQSWRRQAPQHVGEEVGVCGHGEAVEVGARHRVALPSHDGFSPPPVTDRSHWKTTLTRSN